MEQREEIGPMEEELYPRQVNQHESISNLITNAVEDYILKPIVWSLIGRGLKYQEIVDDINKMESLGQISLSTLKRRLKDWGWKKDPPPDDDITAAITLELNGLHGNVGYRYMKHLLLQKYRMFVPEYCSTNSERKYFR